ncbi:MAG: hypothetical protein OQK12_17555 [Motiliproteus sp.]|nr:hypothetical protein [Motiliproteus sp.]MCW9053717.1 hypothetical protein [Motiliproteus sp.]
MVKSTETQPHVAADREAVSQPHAQRETAIPDTGSGNLEQAAGASPSNTAPPNYTELRILRQGVDSLYLSYAGSLTENYDTQLELLKALAQSQDGTEQADAYLYLADHSFTVQPKGRGRFPFLLTDNWYQLQISRQKADKLPLAYVQIASMLLTICGVDRSVGPLNNVVSVLAGKVIHPTVSRVDLCVDFTTDLDLEHIPQDHWVTRATKHSRYYDQKQFSGFTFGKRGAISCRLYDKTLEIQQSQKTYLYDLWKEQGWDEVAPVWRLEFQFNREILSEVGIRSIKDLNSDLNRLWAYAVKWLQLKIPQADGNQSRWPVHSFWEAIKEVDFNGGPNEPALRIRKDRSPSDRSLFVNGLGSLTSFMAREGIQKIDEALEKYLDKARIYHRQLHQRTGKTLNTYVREKVEQKRTRYAARAATESRKQRDGGAHE